MGQLAETRQRLWLQDGFARGEGASRWGVGRWTPLPIALEEFQGACRRFSPSSGWAAITFTPCQLLLLPVALQRRLIDALSAFEETPASISGRATPM
eukprot:2054371-Pyramimonas_sp.AAC.1